ncbi:MAG: recombination regulator RecX [Burkholderiales bacterium]
MKAQRSLRARALQWLAQREQSRSELRRKLLPHAVAEADGTDAEGAAAETSPAVRVEAVLDWLEAHDYLSQDRFVESRVHARASRFGNLRIRQELKQHQIALSVEAAQTLKDSELERARSVLERKFPDVPAGPAERAKQARFLAGRGFSPEVIARALRRDGAEQHATFNG